MAKYKAYPEYKDSGVEWLGEIPLNWHIHSLKRAVDSCTNGVWGGEPDDKHDLIVLRVADFERQSFKISDSNLTTRSILPKDRGSRLLKKGDLLIEKSGGGDKTLVGCVVLFDKEYEAVTSNFVAKMSPRESYDSHFLTYVFSQLYAGKVNYPSIKQTTGIQNLDADAYLMEKFCFPPMHEQRNISCFLDYETAKIDNLIEKQQQLIELLKEKRQAVISHAVTKGLNPDVPMKDSGVEWLGEVPEHWIVRRLKHTANLQSGIPKGKDLTGKNSISVPMLRVANVQDGYLDLEDVHTIDIEPSQLERYLLRDGDVLMNEGGDNDQLGRGAVWTASIDNCIYQNHVFAIRPQNIESDWLDILTRAAYAKFHFYRVAKQSTNLASISSTNIKETPLLIPPVEERVEILKFIKLQLGRLKKSEELSVNQVALLQERRTALISAAVTGKIDVRDWVAPDTQKAEESEETAV